MGGILGGGKKVKAPTPTKVSPAPTITSEAEDDALKKATGGGGFASTILTGDLVPKRTGKKTRLA